MLLVTLRIGDVGCRALFFLLVLYSLPDMGSGQFGLIATLIAFAGFLCGYERYIDVQRKLTGLDVSDGDKLIIASIKLFAINFLLVSLPIIGLLLYWIGLNLTLAVLVLLIVFSEHVSNEVYRYSLIVPHYKRLLWVSLLKNLILLVISLITVLVKPDFLHLDNVIYLWTGTSLVQLFLTLVIFGIKTNLGFKESLSPPVPDLLSQFRASRIHFLIGLLAWVFLQGDRFIVGSILTFEQTGVYFRHVFLATSLYQIGIIIFYNRILHRVYSRVNNNQLAEAKNLVNSQYKIIVPLGVLAIASVFLLKLDHGFNLEFLGKLVPEILALLLAAYIVRIVADYNAMFLNAFHRERYIFYAQGLALTISVVLNVFLTSRYGVSGTAIAVLFGSVIYLILTTIAVSRHEKGIR